MHSNNFPKKIVPKSEPAALTGMSDLRQLRDTLREARIPAKERAPVPRQETAVQKPAAPKESGPANEKQQTVAVKARRVSTSASPEVPKVADLPFRNPPPVITYPEELPVSGRRGEIAEALSKHQVIIVCGETGSGKTTQLPKICLELGRGQKGMIGHTQPRRIAASSTAKRIAQELNSPLGEHVGFKVRFTDTLTKGASVKLMTDGILLAETQTDPLLRQYDTIIIDEAHERSLNIDFLLGYLKQILPKRRDLKLIITSATIDAQRFANHFSDDSGAEPKPAPVIEVSGRLYPVEIRYRPVQSGDKDKERDLMTAITDAVDELCRVGSGDVLVFLPGEREIRDTAEALRKHHPAHVEILPLFARLSAQVQERVF
jgi:ATP-dependent helicase HrpA